MFDTGCLGDLIKHHIGGGTPSRGATSFWNGNIPWASVKDFEDGITELATTQESISEKGLNASSSNLIPAGNLIICSRMAVGRAAICLNDTAINQDLKAIFPYEDVDTRYLLHLINWLRPKIEGQSLGSTVKGIRVTDLLAMLCPVAPSDEQPFIVHIVDNIDTQIRETETIIAKLQQVKQGLLHDLLTRGVDENGELRQPKSDSSKQYYDSESILGHIPKSWSVASLGTLLSGIDGGWSPNCQELKPAPGEWGVLKVSAVTGGKFKSCESKVLPPHLSPRPYIEVKEGDVILTRANGNPELVAKTVYVHETQEKLMLSDKLLRLIPNKRVLPLILVEIMSLKTTRSQILTFSSGSSGQKNISQQQLKELLVVDIPISEQLKMQEQLTSSSKRITDENLLLQKLRLQKSGLMDDLLTGKKRVTDLLTQQKAN